MDAGSQIAYYAKTDLTFLPYADSDLALRYIADRRPEFLVLAAGTRAERPYTTRWFDEGIPDARAQLVYDAGNDSDERIRIYRWRSPAPTAALPGESIPRTPP